MYEKEYMSSADVMISKNEENKYDYIVLFQDPLNWLNPLSRKFCGTIGIKTEESVTDLTSEDFEALHTFITNVRISLKLQEHHKYMIAFAWANPVER